MAAPPDRHRILDRNRHRILDWMSQRIAVTAMASRVATVIGRNPLAIHWAALTARAVWDALATRSPITPATVAVVT
jgi:hypothetical protein